MFALLAAAQLLALNVPVAADLTNSSDVYTTDDIPDWFVQTAPMSVAYRVRAMIGLDGRLDRCVIENPSRDPRLGSLTCSLMTKRGKFQPAKWIDGSPVIGVSRFPIVWTADADPLRPSDMDVTVSKMPDGASRQSFVEAVVAVDENGAIKGCAARSPLFYDRKQKPIVPALARLACAAAHGWKSVPVVSPTGQAARSVQTLVLHFTAGEKP